MFPLASADSSGRTMVGEEQYINRASLVFIFGALVACVATQGFSQSLDSITRPQAGRSMRASSGNPVDNADSEKFDIGETKTIGHLEGPGRINHIWLVPSSMDIRYPRALVLRIYWDGADVPSVPTPLTNRPKSVFHADPARDIGRQKINKKAGGPISTMSVGSTPRTKASQQKRNSSEVRNTKNWLLPG